MAKAATTKKTKTPAGGAAKTVATVKTAATKPEPVKAEPVKTEPVKTEPVTTETVETAPVKTEAVKSETVKSETAETAPAKTEPAKAAPVKAAPVKAAPVKAAPVKPAPAKPTKVKTAPAETGVETVTKGITSAATFGQDNIEAIVASSKIAAKAAESMSTEIAAYSKRSYEDGLAAAKELSSCRSVIEFVEKQTSFTKASLETMVDEAGRLNELYAAAAKEVMAPLNARLSATVGVFTGNRA